MQYPHLKELYAVGFEVPKHPEGNWIDVPLAEGGTDRVYYPTFDELVEACGTGFTELRDLQHLQLHAVHPMDIQPDKKYEAVCTNQRRLKYGHGHTMEEAIKNLYCALANPTFGL